MRKQAIIMAALALGACGEGAPEPEPQASSSSETPAPAAAPGPDLAKCEAAIPRHADDPEGAEPVEFPAQFAGVLANSPRALAVTTLGGGTTCGNMVWVSDVSEVGWLRDDRMLGWEWIGYEAYGYFLVDRAGEGSVIDTGAKPVFSPDGTRMAALQLSEPGWGGMEGFALWQVEPDGLRELTSQVASEANEWLPPAPLDMPAYDWRIEGWRGNDCIDMSAQEWLTQPPYGEVEGRTDFFASAAKNWRVTAGTCP